MTEREGMRERRDEREKGREKGRERDGGRDGQPVWQQEKKKEGRKEGRNNANLDLLGLVVNASVGVGRLGAMVRHLRHEQNRLILDLVEHRVGAHVLGVVLGGHQAAVLCAMGGGWWRCWLR